MAPHVIEVKKSPTQVHPLLCEEKKGYGDVAAALAPALPRIHRSLLLMRSHHYTLPRAAAHPHTVQPHAQVEIRDLCPPHED